MELFKTETHINFMGVRRITLALSALLVLVCLGSFATRGLNFALDFTGGTLLQVNYAEDTEIQSVRNALEAGGYEGATVQRFGGQKDFMIRLRPVEAVEGEDSQAQLGAVVLDALSAGGVQVELTKNEFVGPQVGRELAESGLVAILVVIGGILAYVAARFQWKFGVAAIAGELHDVLLTVGFFSLTGREVDLTVLAAVLAVAGYSINDKIVVFDRIREMFRSARKADSEEIINRSLNTTLSRTIMTSALTLVTVVALFFFGGPVLEGFAAALIVGILVGTMSTIFFAAPILLELKLTKHDLLPVAKEGVTSNPDGSVV